ncbi:efflux RND transporter permease subunit [Govanella unica]|uniref:Efflux pump membrane transporter n=1 Tax=Govanella unica TaxID=2975056 RepID=A0A9X3TYA3_9PROT|nr:efflux RND transporter permease subunit [Govania unica]MDA5193902.1 efflux RND transporter permease subunit [Govania unica]
MPRFFIDRPIFAWVIAIVVMLAGALSILELPVQQYPTIASPSVSISTVYPGASAKTVEDSVTQVIEQQMKGIDNLRYMSSTSDATGAATVTLTFEAGTNPDTAQVQVQNKLQLATPLLPQEVQRQGLVVSKSAHNFMMVLAFVSEDDSMNKDDISDYVAATVLDPLSRVEGVGDVTLFGSQYAMRIWLDPNKLATFKLTPGDVKTAIQAQNTQVSVGELGGTPAVPGQRLNATITAQSRLQTAAEFGEILLRVNTDGSAVKLKDVSRIELGGQSYNIRTFFDRKQAAGLAIKMATGANALQTAKAIETKLDELSKFYPKGLKAHIAFDTTPFVKTSIEEVVKTLGEAIILVFFVMYLFLQNFRATLIPTIAVPVVLLGTFGVLAAFGFSINTLTMFAMVLAIGLLVDDAIVVVENVERIMSEEGLSPLEATRKSMDQITGALVGIALVLSAVFVPMAFFSGSTGVIYRQFSITIVSAMLFSVLVAMILTPALCATLLKPIAKGEHGKTTGFFGWFNRQFDQKSKSYQSHVGKMLGQTKRYGLIYLAMVVVMGVLFWRLPTSFLPDEDQGTLLNLVQLPAGATQERTINVLRQVEDHFLETEKDSVASILTVAGFSFAGSGQNTGLAFVRFKDWSERGKGQSAAEIGARATGTFMSRIRDGMVFAFVPPSVPELGLASGFDMELQDRAGQGHEKLMAARNQLLGLASQDKRLVAVRPNGLDDTPQFKLDIDQRRASALGLSIAQINDSLSSAWGSSYVNDFLDRGRVKRVYVQADAPFRMQPEDLNKWYVRNATGDMVPVSAFATAHWVYGSPRLERYNGLPSVEIQGQAAPGYSSGVAMDAMEELAKQLPEGFGIEWTGLSYEERMSGAQAPALYAISILVVFLCLAALYESWSIPAAVILVVPLGVLGALLATSMRGLSNDVYFQVALLTTVGLAAKNAILIVEFAKDLLAEGKGLVEATLEAVRMRLRPILMTSLAFGFGVLPLAISTGAGSGAQNAVGTGVLGGMFAATALGIFFVPLFFVIVFRLFPTKPTEPAAPKTDDDSDAVKADTI